MEKLLKVMKEYYCMKKKEKWERILEDGKPLGECETREELWKAYRRIEESYWEYHKDFLISLLGEKKALKEHYETLRKIDEEFGMSEHENVRPRNTMFR